VPTPGRTIVLSAACNCLLGNDLKDSKRTRGEGLGTVLRTAVEHHHDISVPSDMSWPRNLRRRNGNGPGWCHR
jgi:hypothetical protein